jgi:hypothetical protein
MKKLSGFLLLILLPLSAYGQRNADYGIFGGVSSYIGDINTNRLFYSPLPAGGLFYRYNLNPRQSIRANISFGGLKGVDSVFNNAFQKNRNDYFKSNVGEFAVQFEFNFLPYSTQGKRWNFSPYIAAGAGIAFLEGDFWYWNQNPLPTPSDPNPQPRHELLSIGPTYRPIIPISLGFKINIFKNLGLEAEYGFRKTFYDKFDGLEDNIDPDHKAWLHNNDWYSFAGISFTWKIYSRLAGCPAFNDVDESRRR